MKGFLLVGVLLSGFSLIALNIADSQLKDLANFYSNLDQISSQVTNNQTPNLPFKTQDLKSLIDAYTNIF